MTEQEKINADVQKQLALQDAKFNTFVEEMRDFKNEMRQQNQMRADEIREMRQDMKDMQNRLDTKIDGIGKHVQNLTVTAMVGVGTSVIAVVVLVGTTIYALLTR
ncbi:MAG: hypothetical protein IJQ85_09415 [Selenomonadaceae bacterium]|nr:hypothetical protein [Selenomonadaceae bacterium]